MRALVEHGPAAQESSKRERTETMIWRLVNLRYRVEPQAETQLCSGIFDPARQKKRRSGLTGPPSTPSNLLELKISSDLQHSG